MAEYVRHITKERIILWAASVRPTPKDPAETDKLKGVPAPRSTKLHSQRDINLWRTPLALSLAAIGPFGIMLIPDTLDKYGVIHIPSWLTMGSTDDARANGGPHI